MWLPADMAFKASALKEWKKLGHAVREQFKKKWKERLGNPHVSGAALSGVANLYKIKLHQMGYRLVYSVEDAMITVRMIAPGKRDRNEVNDIALSRLLYADEP